MRDELSRIERELGKLLAAIKAGGPIEDMKRLEARKAELKDQLANAEEPPPLLHPNIAEIYRQRIAALYENLQNEDGKAEAAEVFRTLVDQVTLVPDEAELLNGEIFYSLKEAKAVVEAGAGVTTKSGRIHRWDIGRRPRPCCSPSARLRQPDQLRRALNRWPQDRQ